MVLHTGAVAYSEWPLDPGAFSAYYSFAPTALALRECVRLQAVRELDLPAPVLDVGCGDGLFARLAWPGKQTWGIDINPSEVQRAQSTQAYNTLVCGNICTVDLPKAFFGSAVANCSLEHVPDLAGALANIRSSLRPGAPFALIVPTPTWTSELALPKLLSKMGMHGLARAYGEALDQVFRHVHLYDDATWIRHLHTAGFEEVEVRPVAGRRVSFAFDAMLVPSLVGYLNKRITGRWVLVPPLRPFTVDAIRGMLNRCTSVIPEREAPSSEYLLVCRAAP